MAQLSRLLIPIFTIISASSSLSSCGSRNLSAPAIEAYPPHFAALRDRVLRPRCGSCHPKILLYKEVRSYLVIPGKASESHLFNLINNGEMPKYGKKLTDEEIEAIKSWINNGATND